MIFDIATSSNCNGFRVDTSQYLRKNEIKIRHLVHRLVCFQSGWQFYWENTSWQHYWTYLLFLYLSWIACCWELMAAQCDSLKCKINSVNLWIWKPVWRSSCADQMGMLKFRRARAMAAADIIDGVYCKYGSASRSDNSQKYWNSKMEHSIYRSHLKKWLHMFAFELILQPNETYLCHEFDVFREIIDNWICIEKNGRGWNA